jgi:hypothetical protein
VVFGNLPVKKHHLLFVFVAQDDGALHTRFTAQSLTALHLALKHAQSDICVYLLDQGMNPNVTDGIGRSPLHVAGNAAVSFNTFLICNLHVLFHFVACHHVSAFAIFTFLFTLLTR